MEWSQAVMTITNGVALCTPYLWKGNAICNGFLRMESPWGGLWFRNQVSIYSVLSLRNRVLGLMPSSRAAAARLPL